MALILRIVKGPNVKKLLVTAAMIASVAAMSLPASATNASGTVTVKWNVTTLLTMSLYGNYSVSGATLASGASGDLTNIGAANAAGGAGSCGGGGTGGNTTGPNITIDFGNITPDLTHVVGCVALNAAAAGISTNDTAGVVLQEDVTTSSANGAVLCGVLLQANKPATWGTTGVSSATYSNTTATDTTDTTLTSFGLSANSQTCSNLQYGGLSLKAAAINVNATALSQSPINLAAADVVTATNNDTNPTFYVGEDYAVLLPANATKGADSAVVTYTVTAQ